MNTPSGSIVSIPMALELDDVITHYHRRVGLARWRQAVAEAIDQLIADGDTGGRQLVLTLHPWLTGHPHRIGYVEEVLADAAGRSDLWITTTGEIADFYLSQSEPTSQTKPLS